jgi:hypothetical protein
MDTEQKPEQCPEFPYFGATYPDATCIDGFLWDLDSNDDSGLLTHGGDDPCPFCNPESFIENNLDEESGVTSDVLLSYIEKLKLRYGYPKTILRIPSPNPVKPLNHGK